MSHTERICILGAGNIGISLAVDLSLHEEADVTLLTAKPYPPECTFTKTDGDTGARVQSRFVHVTAEYAEALAGCSLLFVTVPSFVIPSVMDHVESCPPQTVVFVPGYGGKEFFCAQLARSGTVIAGFERVPCIARLSDSFTVRSSKKPSLSLSCLNPSDTPAMCARLEHLLGIPCSPLANYLTVTLTPSNPLLHTARLYALFRHSEFSSPVPRAIQFYSEWDDESSRVLLAMDAELQAVCRAFPLDLRGVVPLSAHYESPTVPSLTQKIRSIPSLRGIVAPLKETGGILRMDSESRYFREDFPFGLCNIKGFAALAGAGTPMIDTVLRWYEKLAGEEYFLADGSFAGGSLSRTGIPQNFALHSVTDVVRFYTGG